MVWPSNEVARTTPPADVLRKAGKTTSVWLALLLALAGGLVLNLMPCVLPVLSLKALSLADSGRGGGHARASALWYTAGVLLSFLAIGAIALALRAAGQALGWGFQLQQPLVIGALVLSDVRGGPEPVGRVRPGPSFRRSRARADRAQRPGRGFLHRRAGGGDRQPVHRAVHGRCAGLRLHGAHAGGVVGVRCSWAWAWRCRSC